jgi:hypothetical protein
MTSEALFYFYEETKKIKDSKLLFIKAYRILWVGSLVVFMVSIFSGLVNAVGLSEERFYPKDAVKLLRQNLPEGEIFSTYSWGGYLSWKFPERKVFISGLMPIWNYDETPEGELKNAYKTHSKIFRGEQDYLPVFKKFNVNTVLWDPSYIKGGGAVERLLGNIFIRMGLVPGVFDFGEALENDGWVRTYQDDVSIIYKRPQ